MKVLVIGSGGREHALAWKLAQSPKVGSVYVAPGNAGTDAGPRVRNIAITDLDALAEFAVAEEVVLTVVGPEAALAAGAVDTFRARGLRVFGPTRAAARLESSKAFAKAFMQRHGIPTADWAAFDDAAAAHAHIDAGAVPVVVKADGLAAGKGVIVATTRDEAHGAVDAMLGGGQAGGRIVVEAFLAGEEASFIVVAAGGRALPLATSQDHKRIGDGDTGPNTGGMGACSPAPIVTPQVHARVMREIVAPTLAGLESEGLPYGGFLYVGLMIDGHGAPKVVEFNCRLGDPETQPILMRLKGDLFDLLMQASAAEATDTTSSIDSIEPDWDHRVALGVVMAAANYPGEPRRGDAIGGLPAEADDLMVFHAGTARRGDGIVTAGGRVLCVTALGDSTGAAQQRAYGAVDAIRFDGAQFRRDIGSRAIGS